MNFSQFTVDNGAIRDLGELLFLTVFNDPEIERVVTISAGVYNGHKLGYIDDMGDVGKNKSGCSPNYDNINIRKSGNSARGRLQSISAIQNSRTLSPSIL